MSSRRDERCGARFRRAIPDAEPHVGEAQEIELTTLGQAFLEALSHDERFRDVIANPFGEDGPPPGP